MTESGGGVEVMVGVGVASSVGLGVMVGVKVAVGIGKFGVKIGKDCPPGWKVTFSGGWKK